MLLDNKAQGKVGDVLRQSIQKDACLSFISSVFSVYGFAALRQELGRACALRLLVPANNDRTVTPGEQPFRIPGLARIDAGQQRLYFVVQSKSSLFSDALRPAEQGNIDCGREPFKALGAEVHFRAANSFGTFTEQLHE